LADDFPRAGTRGFIVSVAGEVRMRKDDKGETSLSSTLPTVALSRRPNDASTLGVFVSEALLPTEHWYHPTPDERFGIVNALGEGRIWVTTANGHLQPGDLIATSVIVGYGQRQDDDLVHNYTVGKVTEAVDWDQVSDTVEYQGAKYQRYLIAGVYSSG
jgi:hypothetical protein